RLVSHLEAADAALAIELRDAAAGARIRGRSDPPGQLDAQLDVQPGRLRARHARGEGPVDSPGIETDEGRAHGTGACEVAIEDLVLELGHRAGSGAGAEPVLRPDTGRGSSRRR